MPSGASSWYNPRPDMARAPKDLTPKQRVGALPSPAPSARRVRASRKGEVQAAAQDAETLAYARGVLEAEARAILGLTGRLGEPFLRALAFVRACEGQVVVTGMGKAGLIAQKLSSTLASTGIRSLYLHPAEAVHGDLGRVARGDVVIALSNSGATEELVRILPSFRRLGTPIIALTGDPES